MRDGQLPTFDVESKSAKIQKSLYGWPVRGRSHDSQLPTFDAESKSANIPKIPLRLAGCMMTNFQLLMLSPNLLKSKSSFMVGGRGGCMTANFQLLVLSPNLLKFQKSLCTGGRGLHDGQLPTHDAEFKSAKIPKIFFARWGEGVHDGQLPTFDAESKSAKIQKSLCTQWGGRGCVTVNFQLLMLSPNPLKSKNSFARCGRGRGCVMANFQLLMLSPNLLKSKSPYVRMGSGGTHDSQLPTFDAESKSAKIPKSLYSGGGGGGGRGRCMMANFQLLMLSPNLLKSQSPFTVGGGGGWGWEVHDGQLLTLDAESKSAKIPKSLCTRAGGGRCMMAILPTFDAESKSAKIQKSLCGQ